MASVKWTPFATMAAALILGPIVVGILNPPLRAQSPASGAQSPAFEVASIKRNTSTGPSRARLQPGGRFTGVGVTVVTLIRQAYEVLPDQVINAPEWITSERYDIVAKAPDGVEAFSAMAPLLRSLLRDRFGFKAHGETREMPVFDLVLARRDRKLGPKLEQSEVDCTASMMTPTRAGNADGRRGAAPAPPSDQPPCAQMGTPGRRVMRGFPIGQIVRMLGAEINRPVINKTGLTGTWNLELEFAPEQMPNGSTDALPADVTLPSADAPSIFTALQEQLGLKLESAKGPVDVLVIDRVEKPTDD